MCENTCFLLGNKLAPAANQVCAHHCDRLAAQKSRYIQLGVYGKLCRGAIDPSSCCNSFV